MSYASLSVVALLSFLHCASLTHLRIIKQRIFTHLLRRLLNLVRDRTNLYSRKVVLFLDVNTVFNTLAVSFAATSWASGSPNGCVPVWLSWSAGGVLMTQVAYYTAAGIVNIFLRRLTPLIKEKQLEATKQRKRQPFEQEKISRKSFALCSTRFEPQISLTLYPPSRDSILQGYCRCAQTWTSSWRRTTA